MLSRSGRAPLTGSVRTTSSSCSHLQCTQLRQSRYLSKLKPNFGLETAILKLLVKWSCNKVRLGYTSRHGNTAVNEYREELLLCRSKAVILNLWVANPLRGSNAPFTGLPKTTLHIRCIHYSS